jgi:predicted nucleic acid-binding protein
LSQQAVTNSTCLIGLERIGRLDLLPKVFDTVFAPPTVAAEVRSPLTWLTVQPVENSAFVAALKTQMDEGEAEAIALAVELDNVILILDDKKARRVAQQIGLKVIGTVGMLLRAKNQGVITEIKPLLTELVQVEFRITYAIIQEALRLSGEDNSLTSD